MNTLTTLPLQELTTHPTLFGVGLLVVLAGVFLVRPRKPRVLEGRLFTVKAPEAEGAPAQFFAALHGLLRPGLRRLTEGQPWVSLEISGENGQARFLVWIPKGQEPFVEDLLRAAYPGMELDPADDLDPFAIPDGFSYALSPVRLAKSKYLPIGTEADGDTLAPLLSALARPRSGERIHISLLVRPKPNGWQAAARSRAHRLRKGRRSLLAQALLPGPNKPTPPTAHQLEQAKLIEEKARHLGFDCALNVFTVARTEGGAREFLRSVSAALRPFDRANGFSFRKIFRPKRFLERVRSRMFPALGTFILNTEELAALWHLPSLAPPHVEAVRSPKLPAPQDVPTHGRVLGISSYAGHERTVAVSISDSRRHLHVLGPTGTGKTTLLTNLALSDIEAGRGVGIIDPKGDLVEAVLARLPARRIPDVVYIGPEAADVSLGLNPLEWFDPEDKELIAENALSIFKRIYERSWGMRTDDILKSALLTLLAKPTSTLCHVPALLTDPGFRARAISSLDDPIGLDSFWRWFASLSDAQRTEAIGPVLNKLRDFLLRPRIRRLLCQPHSTIDLKDILDSGKILLVNLSTGRWGDTTAALIGSFLFAKIWQQIRQRANVPEEQRRDFFLYIDEFQQFLGVAQSFADTLAQARSFRLSLTLANQHFGQLPKELRESVSSNARTRVVFQCGPDDARYLAKEFGPLDAAALQALPRYHMALRVSVDGETSRPFTAKALPVPSIENVGLAEQARSTSLARFGRPAKQIDDDLRRLLEPEPGEKPKFGVGRRPRS